MGSLTLQIHIITTGTTPAQMKNHAIEGNEIKMMMGRKTPLTAEFQFPWQDMQKITHTEEVEEKLT